MRMNYFQVVGHKVDKANRTEPNMIGIQESGTDRHERIQKYVTKAKSFGYDMEWIDVEEFLKIRPVKGTRIVERKGMETKLFNEVLELSFMCDGIIKLNGKYYILEIKTETSFKWQGRTQPDPKHVVQATSYSLALGIDFIMFLYENRDNCAKKPFVLVVNDNDRFERVIHYIETCNSYRDRKEVPPMSTNKKDCTYCKFTEECKKY
jgi:CRISPR/Cas system-associated exonuclease Cas4 (RecB family)